VSVLLAAAACSSPGEELHVSAAASLSGAFDQLGEAFAEANPAVDVILNFGGSAGLREQILEGAPADVYASANAANMDQLVEAGAVDGAPAVFATNRLQIAVPAGNPGGITGLEDFARDELVIGLCAEGVPCGDLARLTLEKAGVSPSIDTNEPDVRALLTKIEDGELDAGITYVTDVLAGAGAVEGVDIPDEVNVVAEYPIAVLARAPNPGAAEAFVALVLSEPGRSILAEHGFAPP
jgi:molybdate transport system substrate-binding protein